MTSSAASQHIAGLIVGFVLLATGCSWGQQAPAGYRNPNLPIDLRVAELVKRMTMEEKVAQLAGGHRSWEQNDEAKPIFEKMRQLGEINTQLSAHDAAEIRNAAQKYFVEKTRLGIPAILPRRSAARIHGVR
jgi:beta-glucosidase